MSAGVDRADDLCPTCGRRLSFPEWGMYLDHSPSCPTKKLVPFSRLNTRWWMDELGRCRKRLGFTQAEASELTGIPLRTIRRIERPSMRDHVAHGTVWDYGEWLGRQDIEAACQD